MRIVSYLPCTSGGGVGGGGGGVGGGYFGVEWITSTKQPGGDTWG